MASCVVHVYLRSSAVTYTDVHAISEKMNPEYTLLTLNSTCLFTPSCILQAVWAVTNTEFTEVIRLEGFSTTVNRIARGRSPRELQETPPAYVSTNQEC